VWNTSTHEFSPSFAVRRQSCVFDEASNGYWRDSRYLFRADLLDLSSPVSVVSVSACATKCSKAQNCTAFEYDNSSRICKIKSGSVLYACDPTQENCSRTQQGVYGGLTGLFFADPNDLYCSAQSEDCACTREYYSCMLGRGCLRDSDLVSYAQACADKGCSAVQCGLSNTFCNASSRCGEYYFNCNSLSGTSGKRCSCMANLTACLKESGCLFDNENNSFLLSNVFAISKNKLYEW
jgi:hypothetical protein